MEQILVLGGGAAGIAAAISAAESAPEGTKVLLIEQNPRIGKNFWPPETAAAIWIIPASVRSGILPPSPWRWGGCWERWGILWPGSTPTVF